MGFRVAYFNLYHPLAFYSTYFSIKGGELNIPLICSGPEKLIYSLKNPEAPGEKSKKKLDDEKVVNEIALEMELRGFHFLPVDILKSDAFDFTIEGKGLRIPLCRVPGLGIKAAESVIKAKETSPFISIEDLSRRTGLTNTIIGVLKEMGSLGNLSDNSQISLF